MSIEADDHLLDWLGRNYRKYRQWEDSLDYYKYYQSLDNQIQPARSQWKVTLLEITIRVRISDI